MENRRQFRHLDREKRDRLEALLRAGHRQAEIARILKVDRSTVSREIARHQRRDGRYDADTAVHKARLRRMDAKYQGMKVEALPELQARIIVALKHHRSPDEIAGRLRRAYGTTLLGKDAIYRWLYSPYGQAYCKHLCTRRYKRRKQKKKTKRTMIPNRIPLFLRPLYGVHAEGDTAVSPKRYETPASALVVSEKTSKILLGRRLPNLRPATVTAAMNRTIKTTAILTMTMDNGQENRDHEKMAVATYFCDPHSPWQKPHVENGIGLLRRWFVPKKTNWRSVTERQLQKYLWILNQKYRKSLGYRSAYEVALERGIIQKKKYMHNTECCI